MLPLAAAIAFAAALGAIAGAAATSGLHARPVSGSRRGGGQTTPCRRAWRRSAASLRRSRPASPAPSAAPARSSASSPSGSTAPRRRRPSPPPSSPRSRRASTGSIAARSRPRAAAPRARSHRLGPPPKEESKPQVAEGWRLRDFYDGRAMVESRNGTPVQGRAGIERAGPRQGRDHQARERQGRGGDGQRHHRRVARAAAAEPITTAGEPIASHSDLMTGGAARQPPVAFSDGGPRSEIRVRFPSAVLGGWRTGHGPGSDAFRRVRGADRAAHRAGPGAAVAAPAQAGNDGELPRHGGRAAAAGDSGGLPARRARRRPGPHLLCRAFDLHDREPAAA